MACLPAVPQAAESAAPAPVSRPLDPAAAPGVPTLDEKKALALSQSVLGKPVGDFTLLDREGRPVRLSGYRGKPLLVSFIYTGCFEVCPTTTRNLQKAVINTIGALGANRFNVVSVGFNQPFDSPQALKSFAAQNGISYENWEFLSPAPAILDSLTKSFGFSYVATPAGFDHLVQVSIVDGEGKIYRQVYGENISADQLVEPLKQLITGAPVPQTGMVTELLDRVRILCSVYDSSTGQYRLNYGLFFEVGGMLTFLGWLGYYLMRERRNRRAPGV